MAHPINDTPSEHAGEDRPLQDEWGLFDPDQAGFSAVLRKLEEEERAARASSTSAASNQNLERRA